MHAYLYVILFCSKQADISLYVLVQQLIGQLALALLPLLEALL